MKDRSSSPFEFYEYSSMVFTSFVISRATSDVANQTFLAVWDSREFLEPDKRDREGLRELLWLKYKCKFCKNQVPNPPPPQPKSSRSLYDDIGYEAPYERSRREHPMRREHKLFRDGPAPPGRAKG
ncbi:hypothetical protein BWQ96_07417 [Gracilariopsis chorda]|uniref:Uncharacterized protein n=1 Tax=Gracilariopsis chorda TaxID=448386 RepID=A0A2V3IL90_9FLOR|nr:hypothetical protein BWQ96_07417 [Gracilariopsis chorda]|eukprot:PXF42823.1 hypothetical protein BWQ96_07417 [Gracilariopsis chorda]